MTITDPIKYVKLVTGEELISETMNHAQSQVVRLTNPVRIIVMPGQGPNSKPQVGFAPWAPFTEDMDINIDKHHVVAIMDPLKEMKDNYKAMFSPIIQGRPAPLVIPGAGNINKG